MVVQATDVSKYLTFTLRGLSENKFQINFSPEKSPSCLDPIFLIIFGILLLLLLLRFPLLLENEVGNA